MDILESERIKLRALETSDIDILFEWENDPDLWLISNTISPFSRFIIKKYIQNSHLDIYQTKQLRLMIDLKKQGKNETIGTIDLFDFDPYHSRAGIGILIKEVKNRSKGYASEALKLIIDYCFNSLRLHQLYCNIPSDNTSSLNLFRKHGFTVVGEKKEWLRTGDHWINEYLLQRISDSS
ncbi:MAG: GNAT family N-acetyltransferase [Bacteroidales bacterium]|nr:MAG: GNAT family N-acetyltransferase [Bacteroidales bacterium]